MKKALIVATAGGFAIRFEQNNIRLLQEMSYEIHYAADFNNKIYEYSDEYWSEHGIICHQVDFVKKPFDLAGNIRAYKQLRKVINDHNFKLIHCHTPIAAALTRIAAKDIIGAKVLYTAHGFHFYKGAPFSSIIYKIVEKLLAKYTDVLVTINSEDYDNAKKFQLRKGGRVIRIPGAGISTARFKRSTPLYKKAGTEVIRLVSVGELNDNKNHIAAIRGMAILRDLLKTYNIKYEIYGKGPARDKLDQTIKLLRLEDRVTLCGYCEDTAQMLLSADVFLFPSIREGLGLAAVEALAAGVPVIALNQRGSREFLSDGVNGYFVDNDPVAIAKAVKRVLSLSEEELQLMSKQAETSADAFDEKYTVEIMREVYKSIDGK